MRSARVPARCAPEGDIMQKTVVLALLACALGCSQAASSGRKEQGGVASIHVSANVASSDLTRITIEIQPADITTDLTYNPTDGSFGGSIQVPAGSQTFTARAYIGLTLVGISTPVTVVLTASKTTLIQIVILDSTGPAPQPDHGPIITSFTVSNSAPIIGDTLTLTVAATDVDGDTISYLWTQSAECGGSFSAPTNPSTTWTAAQAGPCTLSVTTTSKALSDSRSVMLTVASNLATAQIEGFFVSGPEVTQIRVFNRGNPNDTCYALRYAANGDCVNPDIPYSLLPGRDYQVDVQVNVGPRQDPNLEIMLTNNCTGDPPASPFRTTVAGNLVIAEFIWQSPGSSTLCQLRADVLNYGRSDEFMTALLISQPSTCQEEIFENNNSPLNAYGWALWRASNGIEVPGIYTNDDDWFSFYAVESLTSVSLTTNPQMSVVMDAFLFDQASGTLASTPFASGVGSISLGSMSGDFTNMVFLRIRPDPNATGCSTPYSLIFAIQ
jgi:hypothetical protein